MSHRPGTPASVLAALALLAVAAVSGCGQVAPGTPAPPTPSASVTSPEPTASESAAPAPAATDPAPVAPADSDADGTPTDWVRYDAGDGRTSWSLPPTWTADVVPEVVEGNVEWTDYRGLVRDGDGTPMLTFRAIASGGQYTTDFSPCERPETEVFERLSLGDQIVGEPEDRDGSVVVLAYDDGEGIVFAAGISDKDPTTPCEPGILSLGRWTGYDYLLLQIVDDSGQMYPRFGSFEQARAYLGTDEYAAVRGVLASFEFR